MKKKKQKFQMKEKMSFGVFPVCAYMLINMAVAFAYSAIFVMPEVLRATIENPNITDAQIMEIYNNMVVNDNMYLVLATSAIAFIYVIYSFINRERRIYDVKYENKLEGKDMGILALLGICLYFAVVIVINIILPMTGVFNQSMGELNTTMNTMMNIDLILSIVTIGIIAPVVEELLFRGLMFNRFRYIGTASFAIGVSAFLFAFIHMNLFQMLYTFALGVLFAYVYYKYENILAPIILHIVYNMCSFIGLIPGSEYLVNNVAGLLIIYAVGAVGTLILVKYIIKKPRPQLKPEYMPVAEECINVPADNSDFGE